MRKVFRFLVGGFLIAAALLVAYHYSSDTAIYECYGMLTKAKASNTSVPVTLFIKITQNRFWVFWNPLDGVLRMEDATGSIPTVPGDDPMAPRWVQTGPGKRTALFFPGLVTANAREDLFAVKRVDTFLYLYRWPKAGETVDLTKSTQGGFSTIGNFLTLNMSDEAIFKGICKPKNN